MNAGQTCICSDYVLVDEKDKGSFSETYLQTKYFHFMEIILKTAQDYARIINSAECEENFITYEFRTNCSWR